MANLLEISSAALDPVDRTRLIGHDARPRRSSYSREGQDHGNLWWDYDGASMSASPSSRYTAAARPGEAECGHAVRQLAEKLELPGTPSDYHYAIQDAQHVLWKYRADNIGALEALEDLCWLNIRLLEARPDALPEGGVSYPRLFAFEYLEQIFEQEGYLHEALEVARRTHPFGQLEGKVELLTNRIAAMEAEK